MRKILSIIFAIPAAASLLIALAALFTLFSRDGAPVALVVFALLFLLFGFIAVLLWPLTPEQRAKLGARKTERSTPSAPSPAQPTHVRDAGVRPVDSLRRRPAYAARIDCDYVAIDTETTGLSNSDAITDIGAVFVKNGKIIHEYSQLVNPLLPIPVEITALTGITNEMIAKAPTIDQVLPNFLALVQSAPILGHNINFDIRMLRNAARKIGIDDIDNDLIDTMLQSQNLFPQASTHSLQAVMLRLGIHEKEEHRALADARMTYRCYEKMLTMHNAQPLDPETEALALAIKKQRTSAALRGRYLNGIDTTPKNPQPEGTLIPAERGVETVGEEKHQDALARYGVGSWLWVHAHMGVIETGKYAGQPTICFDLDGEEICHLTALQASRHLADMPKSGEGVCLSHIAMRKKLELRVEFPAVRAA